MTTNRNEVESFGLSPEQLDALFARSTEQQVADAAERHRQAEWPASVTAALVAAGRRVRELEARVTALEEQRR